MENDISKIKPKIFQGLDKTAENFCARYLALEATVEKLKATEAHHRIILKNIKYFVDALKYISTQPDVTHTPVQCNSSPQLYQSQPVYQNGAVSSVQNLSRQSSQPNLHGYTNMPPPAAPYPCHIEKPLIPVTIRAEPMSNSYAPSSLPVAVPENLPNRFLPPPTSQNGMMHNITPPILPPRPLDSANVSNIRGRPPRPIVKVHSTGNGLSLEWNVSSLDIVPAKKFELFSCHKNLSSTGPVSDWKMLGTVDAMTLPMECHLSRIVSGGIYFFAVRSVDVYNRYSDWSNIPQATMPP